MEWFGKLRTWRGTESDGKLGPAEAIASAWGTAIGAEIMGRNKFRVRLWDGLGGLHERYSFEAVTVPIGATHLFFTR